MKFSIAGTTVEAPDGSVLLSAQTHPTLGCLEAQFQVRQTAGDGRVDDGVTWTWRRDTADIPVAGPPEQPTVAPTVRSRPQRNNQPV